ncbi:MAG: hypothetical protein WKF58_02230 [Ilumatobacteraceae bacterium]
MSTLLGYDPIRLVTLRTRVVEAIDALGGIGSMHGSSDDVAYRALATVAATQALLEHDYLRAIDQTLRSDSLDGDDLTVRLAAMSVPREALHGGRRMPSAGEQPFATMTDEELLGWIGETLGRQASDGGPPAAFDDERLFELSAAFSELRRRSVADPSGFGRDLVGVIGSEVGRSGVLRMGDELNVSMREVGAGRTPDADQLAAERHPCDHLELTAQRGGRRRRFRSVDARQRRSCRRRSSRPVAAGDDGGSGAARARRNRR